MKLVTTQTSVPQTLAFLVVGLSLRVSGNAAGERGAGSLLENQIATGNGGQEGCQRRNRKDAMIDNGPRKCGKGQSGRYLFLDLIFDDDSQAIALFNEYAVAVFSDQTNRGSKAIAALGNRFDVPLLLPIVAQRPARGGHVLRQIVFFDESIRPDNLD